MTDLLQFYFYPHASGYASKNLSSFLQTAELAHLLKSESISKDRLPAKLAKRSAAAAAVARPTIERIAIKLQPSKLFSSFFTASGKNGETIRLYGTANKTCFNVNDTTFQITTDPAMHINIFGGTIAQKDEEPTLTNAYISLLCFDDIKKITYLVSFLLVKDLADQITYGQIHDEIIDITSFWLPHKNHYTWLVMTNKNIYIGNGSQETEKLPVTEILSEHELFTCCTRGRYREKPPFMLIGTSLGNIHKINFTRGKFPKVKKCTLHIQEKSAISFICCGHLNNDQYQEFYYATSTRVYFETLNEDLTLNEDPAENNAHEQNALWTRRHTDIPEGFNVGQLMCTQNEQSVIVFLLSKSKEAQSKISIIMNLKPGTKKLMGLRMFINKMPPSDLLYDDMTFAAVDDNEKIQIYSKLQPVRIQRLKTKTDQEYIKKYEDSMRVVASTEESTSEEERSPEHTSFVEDQSYEQSTNEEDQSSDVEEQSSELPPDEESYVEILNDLKDDDPERFWAILEIMKTNGELPPPVDVKGLERRQDYLDVQNINYSYFSLHLKLNALKDKDVDRFWNMAEIVKEKDKNSNLNIDLDENRQENINLMHEFEKATKKSHNSEIEYDIKRLISLSSQEIQTVETKKIIEKVIDITIAKYLLKYIKFIMNYVGPPNMLSCGINAFKMWPTFFSTLKILEKKRFIDETSRDEMKRLINYVDSYKDKPEGKAFLKYTMTYPMW